MKTTLLSLCVLLWAAIPSSAQQTVQGMVYLDVNRNLQPDSGEPALPGVAVSNGVEVVVTDEHGRYQLPVGDDTIIFVIKPSEYELPVNEANLPQFYYIHKPAGSPNLKYKGVPPTGPLPESVNFALWQGQPKETFSILVFGDPQVYNQKEMDYFDRDIVDELEGVKGYEFGISLGDIVGDDLNLYPAYIQSIARIGIPWFNVYGNHDMNYDGETGAYTDETWEATFGPATYSFNYGKVHFINLDNVVYPREDGQNGYIGGFTQAQLRFIENDLKVVPKDYLVVLSFHIPLVFDVPYSNTFRERDQQRLFELLKEFPHTLTLSAHTHIQGIHYISQEWHWQQEQPHVHFNVGAACGDWWSGVPDEDNIPPTTMRDGTPNGYAMLHFNGNQFSLDYKSAREPASKKMSIWGPKVVPYKEWFDAELFVNYWLGNDSTQVEYRVKNHTDWQPMRRARIGDPYITALRVKWDTAEEVLPGKRPSNAIASSHLWRTRMPMHLPDGTYTIQVRATDPLSGVATGEFSYRIKARKH